MTVARCREWYLGGLKPSPLRLTNGLTWMAWSPKEDDLPRNKELVYFQVFVSQIAELLPKSKCLTKSKCYSSRALTKSQMVNASQSYCPPPKLIVRAQRTAGWQTFCGPKQKQNVVPSLQTWKWNNVEHGLLEDRFPLPRGGFPLP